MPVLPENTLWGLFNFQPSKSRDRAVSELKAALDLSEKALKREKDEKEEAQKEMKRLAEELQVAKAINDRLTVALLDKIGKHILLITVSIPTLMATVPGSACIASTLPVQ